MRPKKKIPKKHIVEIYGNWKGVKVEWPMWGDKRNVYTVYYYRYKGIWYPSTEGNLKKRGIIK